MQLSVSNYTDFYISRAGGIYYNANTQIVNQTEIDLLLLETLQL